VRKIQFKLTFIRPSKKMRIFLFKNIIISLIPIKNLLVNNALIHQQQVKCFRLHLDYNLQPHSYYQMVVT